MPPQSQPTNNLYPQGQPGTLYITPPPTPPAAPKGLLSPGNINIYDRPIVPNPAEGKGQSSTVWSSSFGNDDGEVLVPRVTDGEDGLPPHLLSDKRINHQPSEMEAYYQKFHRSLGTFDTPDNATAYAKALHQQQAALIPSNGRTTLPPMIHRAPALVPPQPIPLNIGMGSSANPLAGLAIPAPRLIR